MQRHQYIHHYSNIEEDELQEIENEYRALRFSTRVNRGNVDVDGESTLSDALQWMVSSTENNAEEQQYADYLEDGGTEPIHSYMLISAHPSIKSGDPFTRNGIELTYTNPGVKADGSVADSPPTWTWMISLVCGFRIVSHHVAGPIAIRHRHRSSRIAVIHQQQNPILNRGTPFHPI